MILSSRRRRAVSVLSTLAFAALAVWSPAPASALFLIDDFTLTEDPGLYPATNDAAFPTAFERVNDTFNSLGGQPTVRVSYFAPILSSAQIIAGNFSGQQTIDLDTTAGRITSSSTGDGAPLIFFIWTSNDLATQLDLDVSGEEGFYFSYEASAAVNLTVSLVNNADDDGNDIVGGNETTVLLSPGVNNVYLPFSSINTPLTELDISSPPPFPRIELPALDHSSLDGISMLINPIEDVTVPEGLAFSLDYVAFVPEPVTAVWMGALAVAALRRRSLR